MTISAPANKKSDISNAIVTASHCIMGLLFVAAGVVQLNDPDPLLWILAYWGGAAAIFATAIVSNKEVSKGMLIFSGVLPAYLLGFSLLALGQEYKKAWIVREEQHPLGIHPYVSLMKRFIEIEETREAVGMLFLCLYLGVAYASCSKASKEQEKIQSEDPMNVDIDCDGKLEKVERASQFPSYITAVVAGAFAVGYAISWVGWKTALSNDAVSVGEHCKGIL